MEMRRDERAHDSSVTAEAMASAARGLSVPPQIARVSPGNLRSLILEKEKELHDINDYRIHTLESLLREKETAAHAYKNKFAKLQEDFKYNLKLLEGRDEELALYDSNFATLKATLRDREAEVSEWRAQHADVQAELKQERQRAKEQEVFFQQKLKDARAQMEGTRWNFDDELRRTRDEMEQAKRKMERQLREQQEDLETQRREVTLTFDDVMRQREGEFKRAQDESQARTRELELQLKASTRESEMARDRSEELKMKLENMQQLLSESEKQTRDMEWQLADVRSGKDARIAELEEEMVQLQQVKQSLLDEYEGKMAELLQSLHSVEKAFAQQKAQYEDDLQRHTRVKQEEAQSLTLRMDGKVQSLMAKLRQSEEANESVRAELKQLKWESEDALLEKDRELDRLRQQLEDGEQQRQSVVSEMKQQLWVAEREKTSLQEKLKDSTQSIQMHAEKDKLLRQELTEASEKEEDYKREIVTLNLRWENKWQEQQQELTSRHEVRISELQHARDRVLAEKQSAEDRLVHAENELHRLRAEVMTLKSDARVTESFGRVSVQRPTSIDKPTASPATGSPLWSDDNGTLSPLANISPVWSESPLGRMATGNAGSTAGSAFVQSSELTDALQAENAKLKGLIREMKNALTQQAEEMAAAASPDKADSELAVRLAEAEKQCVLLQAKLVEAEATLQRVQGGHEPPRNESGITAISPDTNSTNEVLVQCQADLEEAKRAIEMKNARINELETELEQVKRQLESQPSTESNAHLAAHQVAFDGRESDLKRQLASAHADLARVAKERTQLMELSNQLTAELRRLKENPRANDSPGGHGTRASTEFAGKKDYENLITELSRSLEESRVHNKTLKKELRRMVKLQVLTQQQQQHGGSSGDNDEAGNSHDCERSYSTASGNAEGSVSHEHQRRRTSTLSMLQALETQAGHERRSSRRTSVASSVASSSASTNVFDDELLSLVRSKLPDSSPVTRRSSSVSQSSSSAPRRRATAALKRTSTIVSQSIPENDAEDDEEKEDDDGNDDSYDDHAAAEDKRMPSPTTVRSSTTHNDANGSTERASSSLSMLFSRERMDAAVPSSEADEATGMGSTRRTSDARARLQHAKEMLQLAGKKAERSASLATSNMAPRSSARETPSQKSVIKKLKDLQNKRAEMVTERKKVRNYSLA